MRIALAQLNFHIGHFEQNTARIIEHIRKARREKADIIVFAELAICGYPPRDFLEFEDFIKKCEDALQEIAKECHDIAAVIGAPVRNPEAKGKDLYNAACFLADGQLQATYHKALLPTYDIFDEYRYFEPGHHFHCVEWGGKKIALTVCEDLWNIVDNPLYRINPMDQLMTENPDLVINIAASPFHYDQAETRRNILSANVKKYKLPIVYLNHVGAQTQLLFDGGSMVMGKNCEILHQCKFFEEDFITVDLDQKMNKTMTPASENNKIERIHNALVMGIRDYFSKLNFKTAILGLSGGIDSALTLALAVEALGKEMVRAVLLPSRFSSQHSVDDALALVKNLGCPHDLISIEDVFHQTELTLAPAFEGTPFNLTEENIQARIRAVILMALSNKFGYILLNTSNKSEAAVGYGTLYGDMCGGLSVLGDVYKTQVYQLAHFVNRNKEIIPQHTIDKPPSAELRPDQKDSDSLPEYEILDRILFEYIEKTKGPAEIVALGFEKALVDRVLKMVNTTEYKRHQAPPILRVSPKAFGSGRRMPIVAKYLA